MVDFQVKVKQSPDKTSLSNLWLQCIFHRTVGVGDDIVEATVFGQPFGGGFRAAFRYARHVVDAAAGEDPADHLSWLDAKELLEAGDGLRRSAMYAVGGVAEPEGKQANLLVGGMAVNADFFAMFEAPFLHGGAWSAEDDARGGAQVVLSSVLAERLFGKDDPTGKRLRMFEAVQFANHAVVATVKKLMTA